jgi:hypothetical protein
MRDYLSAAVTFSLFAWTAQAGGLSDCGHVKTDCRDLIGKRLWVVVPPSNPFVVEVHPTPNDITYENALKLRTGSFLVKDVIPEKFGFTFVVTLPNGKTGYVGASHNYIFLATSDPVEDARKQREECERRGQPKIGMTMDEATATCWGKPHRVVKTTTAGGVQQDFIYTRGHILRFENDKLSAILETAGQ